MWLLNARTYKLEYFQGDRIPPYAILSHRWQDQEVSFQDIDHPEALRGWTKIKNCCRQTIQYFEPGGTPLFRHTVSVWDDGSGDESLLTAIDYTWIDTCCIDKTSSAELSEAINSMYDWYAKAEICFVYLHDVSDVSEFSRSDWFTRGWTLQELLAPREISFYNSRWEYIGNKRTLADEIATVTKIPPRVLDRFDPRSRDLSVADKMSWAAGRKTTRIEDRAYSLLGMFDINMPMLYGEGPKAFLRLQEEIMRTNDDLTLFLWTGVCSESFSLLANSPSDFESLDQKPDIGEFTLNNTGLAIRAFIQPLTSRIHLVYLRDWRSIDSLFDGVYTNQRIKESGCPIMFVRHITHNRFSRLRIGGKAWIVAKDLRASFGTLAMNTHSAKLLDIYVARMCLDHIESPIDGTCKIRMDLDLMQIAREATTVTNKPSSIGNVEHIEFSTEIPVRRPYPHEHNDLMTFGRVNVSRDFSFRPASHRNFFCCFRVGQQRRLGDSEIDIFLGHDFCFEPICLVQTYVSGKGPPALILQWRVQSVAARVAHRTFGDDPEQIKVPPESILDYECYTGTQDDQQAWTTTICPPSQIRVSFIRSTRSITLYYVHAEAC